MDEDIQLIAANILNWNTKMPLKKNRYFSVWNIIIALVVVIGWLLLNSLIHVVPKNSLTLTRMRVTQSRIIDYYKETGYLPKKLIDLPKKRKDRDLRIVDAWGIPIGYRIENKIVTLESYGQDGLPDGTGMDKDIFITFDPNTSKMLEWHYFSN